MNLPVRVMAVVRRYPLPVLAALGLVAGLLAGYAFHLASVSRIIFLVTLVVVGLPVVTRTALGMLRGKFATDVVATLAIVGAAVTQEYLAGCIIVLMQTGGEALEAYAVRRASNSLPWYAPLSSKRRRSVAWPIATPSSSLRSRW